MSSDDMYNCEPCYVVSRKTVLDNIKRFESVPELRIAYSVKTNSSDDVLKIIKESGTMVEIVSRDEYEKVRRVGFENSQIIYNGVMNDPNGRFAVASGNGIVNIENLSELESVGDLARMYKRPIKIGMRINLSFWYKSRFGFEAFGHEYEDAKRYVSNNEFVEFDAVHLHVHGQRSLESWKTRARVAAEVASDLHVMKIDLGSNLLGPMHPDLLDQIGYPLPSVKEYYDAIYDGISEVPYFNNKRPEIILEPGTAIIGNGVCILGKVTCVRHRNCDVTATTDVSMYDAGFFRGSKKHVPFRIINQKSDGEEYSCVKIYGYACTEDDVISENYCGRISEGDLVVIENIGAYGYSLSSDFIQNKMAVVVV